MASLSMHFDAGLARREQPLLGLVPRSFGKDVEGYDLRFSSAADLEAATAEEAHYFQLGAGPFRGRKTGLRSPRFDLSYESWSRGMLKRSRVPAQKVAFVVPVGRGHSGWLQRRPVGAGEVAVLFDGESYDYRSAAPAEIVTVTFVRDVLEAHARSSFGRGLGELRLRGRLASLRVDPGLVRGLCLEAPARRPPKAWVAHDGSFLASLESRLVKVLLGTRTAPPEDGSVREPQGRSRLLALEAEAWLSRCLGEPPRIADLCHALGAGERTIHEAFKEHLGTTPMAYLRALRLNSARHDLGRANARTRVTDVALDWGFLHFGRFSQDYRRFFGETPSQTLRRARTSAAGGHGAARA